MAAASVRMHPWRRAVDTQIRKPRLREQKLSSTLQWPVAESEVDARFLGSEPLSLPLALTSALIKKSSVCSEQTFGNVRDFGSPPV